MTPSEPRVGDFIVLVEDESDAPGEPPIAVLRITEAGYEAVGEGWPEQAEELAMRARRLAHEAGARAWRHSREAYTLLAPFHAPDVH